MAFLFTVRKQTKTHKLHRVVALTGLHFNSCSTEYVAVYCMKIGRLSPEAIAFFKSDVEWTLHLIMYLCCQSSNRLKSILKPETIILKLFSCSAFLT